MNDAMRHSIEVVIEFKKPKNIQQKDHSPHSQLVCERLAASFLSRHKGVVSVLTDLNHSWVLYWFAAHEDTPAVVGLYKLELENSNEAAGLARYLLESLHDESHRGTLPATFADRLSFEEVMDKLLAYRDHKRAKTDAKYSGDSTGGGGGSSTQLPDQNTSWPKHQPPPSNHSGSNLGAQKGSEKSHSASLTDAASTYSSLHHHPKEILPMKLNCWAW